MNKSVPSCSKVADIYGSCLRHLSFLCRQDPGVAPFAFAQRSTPGYKMFRAYGTFCRVGFTVADIHESCLRHLSFLGRQDPGLHLSLLLKASPRITKSLMPTALSVGLYNSFSVAEIYTGFPYYLERPKIALDFHYVVMKKW